MIENCYQLQQISYSYVFIKCRNTWVTLEEINEILKILLLEGMQREYIFLLIQWKLLRICIIDFKWNYFKIYQLTNNMTKYSKLHIYMWIAIMLLYSLLWMTYIFQNMRIGWYNSRNILKLKLCLLNFVVSHSCVRIIITLELHLVRKGKIA